MKEEAKKEAEAKTCELKAWFASHSNYPYPDEEAKADLARKTNKTVAQV